MIKSKVVKFIVGLVLYALPFAASAELVNINNASAAAMSHHLKGIGAKKAQSIVSYREINGDFKVISDITNVKGIGEGLLNKNIEGMSLTMGAVKYIEVKAKDKVVVIGSKKTIKLKEKFPNSKLVVSNDVEKSKQKVLKKKKTKVKFVAKELLNEKKSLESTK